MILGIALGYTAWWATMHLSPMGLDDGTDGEVSQPYEDNDPYHVENHIHDGHP